MGSPARGGYDDGYARSECFWGRRPGSLVQRLLAERPDVSDLTVLDLGCGEGKNAFAFAEAGAEVVAVDCSHLALRNGQRAFPCARIRWVQADARTYIHSCDSFDIIIMYGLLHCLPSPADMQQLVAAALGRTRSAGHHIVVTFNDGPHDLRAHPGFTPTLAPHQFFLRQYESAHVIFESNSVLHESHPNNNIRHFHSVTRLIARKDK